MRGNGSLLIDIGVLLSPFSSLKKFMKLLKKVVKDITRETFYLITLFPDNSRVIIGVTLPMFPSWCSVNTIKKEEMWVRVLFNCDC